MDSAKLSSDLHTCNVAHMRAKLPWIQPLEYRNVRCLGRAWPDLNPMSTPEWVGGRQGGIVAVF